MQKRGIYFLANDRLFDPVVAFLNSLRTHNPEMPLCLIPYDSNTSRIQSLASRYNFTTLEDEAMLSLCDQISLIFHDRVRGHYRKIAAWKGVFEEFLYIDIDTVVLRPVDFIFELMRDYDVVTAHSNEPTSRQFVWKDTNIPATELTPEEIEYSANTGFILSKNGLFDREGINSLADRAGKLARHMELQCFEQPPLNYFIVKSTDRYTSIRHLNEQYPEMKLPVECWAGDDAWKIQIDGTSTYQGKQKDVLLVHWAGVMVPTKWEKRLFSVLNKCGISTPPMRMNLKQGRLWRHYRNAQSV